MSILFEERPSDSPYIESITHGWTVGDGSPVRPAEVHWHLVLVKIYGCVQTLVVGPWSAAGVATYSAGAEILWIKFKLGTFMPHLPTKNFLDSETLLPDAASQSFWLHGSAWQVPDFNNAETFIERLAHSEVLVRDPVVEAVLRGQAQEMSPRTVRHRFLQATGLPQQHIRQYERAQQAASLLTQGVSILDVVDRLDYFDQPHLTRSLKRFVGVTPAQAAPAKQAAIG